MARKRRFIFVTVFTLVIIVVFRILILPHVTKQERIWRPETVAHSKDRSTMCVHETIEPREMSGNLITMTTDGRRLGNKLFVYASLLGIATRENREVILPQHFEVFQYFETHFAKKVNNTEEYLANFVRIKEEKAYVYDKSIEYLNKVHLNVKLCGYFLSWRYFHDISDTLRKEFRFTTWYRRRAQNIIQRVATKQNTSEPVRLIGIQVRRGDLNSPREIFRGFQVAPRGYFHKAMNYFREKYRHVEFVVCSDDPHWCRQNIQGSDVTFVERQPAPLDLAVLARCDDVIMSVGTFGWWAGWLAGGDVIYYKHWYKAGSPIDSVQNGLDHFPPAWIGMT